MKSELEAMMSVYCKQDSSASQNLFKSAIMDLIELGHWSAKKLNDLINTQFPEGDSRRSLWKELTSKYEQVCRLEAIAQDEIHHKDDPLSQQKRNSAYYEKELRLSIRSKNDK